VFTFINKCLFAHIRRYEVGVWEHTCRWVAGKPYKRCMVDGIVRSTDSAGGEIIAELPAWQGCPEACYHFNRYD